MSTRKSYKNKKARNTEKKRYVDPTLMNQLSETFNQLALDFKRGAINLESFKAILFDEWESIKGHMATTVTEKTLLAADLRIQEIAEFDDDNIFDRGNDVIDSHRRQGDVALSKAKNSMLHFWVSAAYGDHADHDLPWLRRLRAGEKFMPFYESGNRYIFQGHANQLILAMAQDDHLAETGKQAENIVLFAGEIRKLLDTAFQPDPNSNKSIDDQQKSAYMEFMKGRKSHTSLFVRTLYNRYTDENGHPWSGPNGEKYPTKEDLASGRAKKIQAPRYVSHPVWLAESLIDDLPALAKEKYQALLDERVIDQRKPVEIDMSNNGANLNDIVDKMVQKHVADMAIEIGNGGNRAYYAPSMDRIQLPDKNDFINPVLRYAVTAHELAHSTMHLDQRYQKAPFGSVPYAQEEVIAESTALLMVNDLRERLTEACGDNLPVQWQEFFEDYYNNSASYADHWGGAFNFKGMIDQLFEVNEKLKDSRNDVFNYLVEHTMNAYTILKTGRMLDRDITPELRAECLRASYNPSSELVAAL